MRTQITTAIATLIAVAGMMTSAQAQVIQGQFLPAQPQVQVLPAQPQVQILPAPVQTQPQAQAYVVPGYPPAQPPVSPPPQNQFYFGVNVQLNNGYQGTTLRVTSVTPGSPAQTAGLEIGDEIRTVNGRSFEQARDSFHAVSMMNSFVTNNNPAPAVAAAAQAYVSPQPAQPYAQMLVRNVRNGQNVWVNVYPQRRGWNGPAPAAAAPAYTPAPAYTAPAPTPATPAVPSTPAYTPSTH